MSRPKGSRNKPKDDAAPKKPRAKKKEQQPASSRSSAAASANSDFKKPTADQVVRLVKSLVSMGNDARAVTTAVGEKIAKAVETQHFDKKALSIVKGLYQMSINRPEAFAVTLPHLLSYIDDLGLDKVANEARGLDLAGEDDDEGTGDEAPDEQPASGRSPGLRVVPGPAAPSEGDFEVPAAPEEAA